MNEPNLGRHVAHVHNGPTKSLGIIIFTSGVRLQQQLPENHQDGAFQVSLRGTVSNALELGSA